MANPEKDIVCKLAASISQRLSTQVSGDSRLFCIGHDQQLGSMEAVVMHNLADG